MTAIVEVDNTTVMQKVVNESGQVAVLYSPTYGAGWYTWNTQYPDMIFDPSVVHMVLDSKDEKEMMERVTVYASLKWPEAYLGGVDGLTVAWIPEGKQFRITEYDGNESIDLKDNDGWFVA